MCSKWKCWNEPGGSANWQRQNSSCLISSEAPWIHQRAQLPWTRTKPSCPTEAKLVSPHPATEVTPPLCASFTCQVREVMQKLSRIVRVFFQSSQFGKWSNAYRWVNSRLWFLFHFRSFTSYCFPQHRYFLSCRFHWSGRQRHYPTPWSTWILFSGASTSHRNKCRSREPLTNFRPPRKQPKSWRVGGVVRNHELMLMTTAPRLQLCLELAKIHLDERNFQSWSAKSGEVETKWPGNHSKEAILAVWKPHSERWIIGVPEVKLQTKILFAASPRMKYITQTHNGYTTLWRISSISRTPILHEFWLK